MLCIKPFEMKLNPENAGIHGWVLGLAEFALMIVESPTFNNQCFSFR
jgi:hypothetical protein